MNRIGGSIIYGATDPETGDDLLEKRAAQLIADGALAVIIGTDRPADPLLIGTTESPASIQALFDAGVWSHPGWTLFAADTVAVKGRCAACGTTRSFRAAKTDGRCWNHTITPVVTVNGISIQGDTEST